jgi:periplasmic protein TonB
MVSDRRGKAPFGAPLLGSLLLHLPLVLALCCGARKPPPLQTAAIMVELSAPGAREPAPGPLDSKRAVPTVAPGGAPSLPRPKMAAGAPELPASAVGARGVNANRDGRPGKDASGRALPVNAAGTAPRFPGAAALINDRAAEVESVFGGSAPARPSAGAAAPLKGHAESPGNGGGVSKTSGAGASGVPAAVRVAAPGGSAGGGDGAPVGAAAAARRSSYAAQLKGLVEAHKVYPVAARSLGREGSCLRRFVLGRDGALKRVESLSSCGHPFLDGAATRAITGVGRFPRLPEEYGGTEESFTVTMTFTLAEK